jgi:malonyl CoA-acyl carrier protein transacylase
MNKQFFSFAGQGYQYYHMSEELINDNDVLENNNAA